MRRLTGRGTEPPEVIERRLAAARVELAAEPEFDQTLVNTSVEDVARELLALTNRRVIATGRPAVILCGHPD
ncbi:Guanylate kinase [Streptomyces tendae]